jgi:hypothetical protein
MWVALEYIQSNNIIILAEDYSICETNARDLSSNLEAAAGKWTKTRGNGKVTLDIQKSGSNWNTMVSWGDMETWKKHHSPKHRTLGFAIGILGRRKCREQRDYFLALGGMLNFKPKQDPLILVQDTFQYFLIFGAVYA